MSAAPPPHLPPNAPDKTYEVTPLELFFDLVFVFAVSQLSQHLLTHLSWRGAAETLVMLLAVYAVWSYTSWAATMIPADEPRTRRMLLAVMPLGLFMNASATEAFATSGWAFDIPLLLIQLGRSLWTLVNSLNVVYWRLMGDERLRRAVRRGQAHHRALPVRVEPVRRAVVARIRRVPLARSTGRTTIRPVYRFELWTCLAMAMRLPVAECE